MSVEAGIEYWSLARWSGNTDEKLEQLIKKHQAFIDTHPGQAYNTEREQWITEIRAELESRKSQVAS